MESQRPEFARCPMCGHRNQFEVGDLTRQNMDRLGVESLIAGMCVQCGERIVIEHPAAAARERLGRGEKLAAVAALVIIAVLVVIGLLTLGS